MVKTRKMIGETKLERAVARLVNRNADGDIRGFLEDLAKGGCASGLVGELIYYVDTIRFYKHHRQEIADLLEETCNEFGGDPADVFGDKWDKDDPLARRENNQNLLAWFAFEETAHRLGIEQGFIED